MDHKKYTRQYYLPPKESGSWAGKDYADTVPVWCSVDLRDGNQSLPVPMTAREKTGFFRLLTDIGFKEIEAGFPASSETEYGFIRTLIEGHLIPDDVTIQVLTQAREHIIRRTFDALEGTDRAIIHLYSPVSEVQRRQVYRLSEREIIRTARDGARMIKNMADERGKTYRFEYSPEYFSGTKPEFALEVCNAVLDVWQPSPERKAIINLPATLELALPHVYASQVQYMSDNLICRDSVVLSLHPHNDRGCAVADAELGILAGAQRIEGTLFGNGERAGNVDLITLAMNHYSHGKDPGLDLGDLIRIRRKYEEYTGMKVGERNPYSGDLAYAAFSGSHQDAIAKSMKYREEHPQPYWTVPYLIIDPDDVGHSYDAEVIRINSQSGKGGVEYVLEQHFGLKLPELMQDAMREYAKAVSDENQKELLPEDIFSLFREKFENTKTPYQISEVHFRQHNGIIAEVTTTCEGKTSVVLAPGSGRLDAVSNALKKVYPVQYDLVSFQEHALEKSSSSRAIAYIGIRDRKGGRVYWGAGTNVDIIRASIDALLAAVNNLAGDRETTKGQ